MDRVCVCVCVTQEKLDHLGITALILGTPFTAALVSSAMH